MGEVEDEETWGEISVFDLLVDESCTKPVATESIPLSDDVSIVIDAAAIQVWGSARLLAAWLLTEEGRALVNSKEVLEVGAGLGLPTISCAIAGASRAIATDLCHGSLEALQRLLDNRYSEAPWTTQVEAYTLNWTHCCNDGFKPRNVADVVIAADCHYYSAALRPLVVTILLHLKPGGILILASKEGRVSLPEGHTLLVSMGFVKIRCVNLRSELLQLGLDDDHFATFYSAPCSPEN